MLVVVFSLLDKQDLPAESLSPARPCSASFLSWKEAQETNVPSFAGCRKRLVLTVLWLLSGVQPVLKIFVSSRSWEIKYAICSTCSGTPSCSGVASPGVGAACLTPGYPPLTARRWHQSLYSGISESVTCKPTPIARCLTSVYSV